MRFRVSGAGLAIVALAAIGCGDRGRQLPAAPRMQTSQLSASSVACDFKSLDQLATHYFPGPEARVVRDIIDQMEEAGAFSLTAKNGGFDVMTHIAANVKQGNTDVAEASSLTNGLLACMFNDPDDLPLTFPEDFSVATDPSLDGGYEVRGGPFDLPDEVLSRPFDAPFSGIAPCTSASCGTFPQTWAGVLSGSPDPKRVLVYGAPGLTPNTYDWRVVPRSTQFSPAVFVGICLSATATENATSLIHEEHVGLLPFADVDFLPVCSGFASQSWTSQLSSRLARWGLDLLGRPLSATTSLNPGGLAGSTGSLRSEFGPEEADTVRLKFEKQPSDISVGDAIFPPVVISARNATTGSPVANVTVTLVAVNNNGEPAILLGTTTRTTGYDGLVTFDDLSQTKTGAYRLVASGSVGGRPAIVVPTITSKKFNVRP